MNFPRYPEGPRGGDLLRLMHGILGKPLSDEAVRAIATRDAETRAVMSTLQSAVDNAFPEDILEAARRGGQIWNATSMLARQAAEGLNALGRYDDVLELVGLYQARFDRSIRLQHLEALACTRTARYAEALKVLGKLHADGHRDPETELRNDILVAERAPRSPDRRPRAGKHSCNRCSRPDVGGSIAMFVHQVTGDSMLGRQ